MKQVHNFAHECRPHINGTGAMHRPEIEERMKGLDEIKTHQSVKNKNPCIKIFSCSTKPWWAHQKCNWIWRTTCHCKKAKELMIIRTMELME